MALRISPCLRPSIGMGGERAGIGNVNLWIWSFPNCLEGSKCGGYPMNGFELDNIMCVELLNASEKMLSKYTVLTSKIMIRCSIYSTPLPTCQLFPRAGGKMNGQDGGRGL